VVVVRKLLLLLLPLLRLILFSAGPSVSSFGAPAPGALVLSIGSLAGFLLSTRRLLYLCPAAQHPCLCVFVVVAEFNSQRGSRGCLAPAGCAWKGFSGFGVLAYCNWLW
jgi:hypothetical protein